MTKQDNRARFLACLPATQAQVVKKLKISPTTASRLARYALASDQAHIGSYVFPEGAKGPQQAVYVRGPGVDAPKPRRPYSPKEFKRRPVQRDPRLAARAMLLTA